MEIGLNGSTLQEANTQPCVNNTNQSNKYNGWTNFETWLLRLNLDNDYGCYLAMQEYFDDIDKSEMNG